MKIVINTCYGGFGLSKEALALYNERSRTVETYDFVIKRDDPILVKIVEELGEDASDRLANLKVVEIPDDVVWGIEEYDGNEWIAEKHRTWK
jgi:hypothetical protein